MSHDYYFSINVKTKINIVVVLQTKKLLFCSNQKNTNQYSTQFYLTLHKSALSVLC